MTGKSFNATLEIKKVVNKRVDKKNNSGLIVLVIVLFLLVLGLGGYIIYDKVLSNKTLEGNNTNSNNQDSSTVTLKADSAKDWVYDADYNLPTNKESYYGFSDHSRLVKASDLIVPYININSSDATKANQEIYKLYEQLINTFNENLKEEIWFTTVKYSTYVNNNIISVLITTETAGTDVPLYEYYTYNFNLENGKLLSYSEAYEKLGYNQNSIKDKAINAITNAMKEKYNESDFNNYNNKSIDNYTTSVSDEKIKYYIDNNNKLNIIVTLVIPAGRGTFDTVIALG